MKADYLQERVGHYGVFNGSRFRNQIVPRILDFHAMGRPQVRSLSLVNRL
jgi:poly(3-hydroxybutyrate) depolymerase